MSEAPLRFCSVAGCRALTRGGACPTHRRRETQRRRSAGAKHLYGHGWRAARRDYLAAHPACTACGAPATVVDHRRAHRGDPALFWDRSNWQPLCKPCHDQRTDEGDFGRGRADAAPHAGRRVVVTGRPGAGKSTAVDTQIVPGDLVFDYDRVLRCVVAGLEDTTQNPTDLIPLGEALRDAFVAFAARSGTRRSAYVIAANPRTAQALADQLGASLLDLG